MQTMKPHFKPDYTSVISQPQCIFKGQKYRITILSDVLVRLEYSDTGYFEDRPTELVCNRNFPIPQMKVDQNEKILDVTTKYFN